MFALSLLVFWSLDISSMSIVSSSTGKLRLFFKGNPANDFDKYAFLDSDDNLFIATDRKNQFINFATGEIKSMKPSKNEQKKRTLDDVR